jgi:hypothetical protein
MNVYHTAILERFSIGFRGISGPNIIACDETHAKRALAHLGYPDFIITYHESLPKNTVSIVEWDSLILPNEFQLN